MVKFQDCSSFVFHRDSPFEFSSGAKGLLGCITKKNYDFRVKQDYLRKQEGLTVLYLVCTGSSVFGRMAFDSICYHPVFFGKPHVTVCSFHWKFHCRFLLTQFQASLIASFPDFRLSGFQDCFSFSFPGFTCFYSGFDL